MKKRLLKVLVAASVLMALFLAGNAWADGHGYGHRGHGYHAAPPHHGGHYYPRRPVYAGPRYVPRVFPYAAPRVHHYVQHVVHRPYYVPAPVHHGYYVPYATTYVAPPPPPAVSGFSLSAIINEPGFSLGISAGN